VYLGQAFPFGSSFSRCSGREPLGLVERFFTGRMSFPSPNHQCQSTEGKQSTKPNQWPGLIFFLPLPDSWLITQSTDPNQWPGLILSSSTTGVLTRYASHARQPDVASVMEEPEMKKKKLNTIATAAATTWLITDRILSKQPVCIHCPCGFATVYINK